MSSRDTLRTLISVSRSRPEERELCCPNCGGPVWLHARLYECPACTYTTAYLATLAVREVPRG